MSRIKRCVTTKAKHKRILDQAKGYRGRRKNTIRVARQAVEKAGQYAYRDRKVKKRSFRALWIQRINAAVRAEGLTYSRLPPTPFSRASQVGSCGALVVCDAVCALDACIGCDKVQNIQKSFGS